MTVGSAANDTGTWKPGASRAVGLALALAFGPPAGRSPLRLIGP